MKKHNYGKASIASIARIKVSKLQANVFAFCAILCISFVMLASSCEAPALVDDSSAPGAASMLSIDADLTDSSSIVVQWTAPTNTGTKQDGTALSPEELVYRVYYLAETPGQAVPTAEEILQNTESAFTETRGTTRVTITNLEPLTGYFVTVATINSFADLETLSAVLTARTKNSIELSAPGAASMLSIDADLTDSTSFVVQWTAPTNTGTKQDGTALSPEELVYRVYYLAETPGQAAPTAEEIKQNSNSKTSETIEPKEPAGTTRVTISNLESGSLYYIVVLTINSFTESESLSNVLEAPTNMKLDFEGVLSYLQVYQRIVNAEARINPNSIPSKQSTDTSDGEISYVLERIGGTADANLVASIDSSAVITIEATTNTGTVFYKVQAIVNGYNTQETIISIQIVSELELRVSSYYGESTNIFPLELGQAIEDDSSMPFALNDNDSVLSFSGLMQGEFSIHFANDVANFDASNTINKSDDGNGVFALSKSDLANITLVEEMVIGISGPGITNIEHVATYHPFNIYNHQDVQAMRFRRDGDYVLKNDIIFPAPADATTSNYEAVGDDMEAFTGTFNGAGYSIRGIQIYTESGNYQGLFGVIEAADASDLVVQNLELIDFKITGNAYVGSVAAWIKRGTVDNVDANVSTAVAGKVELRGSFFEQGFNYAYGGGLFGSVGTDEPGMQVSIRNSSSAVTVRGMGADSNRIGGLVGRMESNATITDSFATGDVTGVDEVGGLIGKNSGSISSAYATGNVTGDDELGALIGVSNGTVSGYATGTVTGSVRVGGLVGWNVNATASGYATGAVTGSNRVGGLAGDNSGTMVGYATGIVTGENAVGGLIGWNENGTVPSTVAGYSTGLVIGNDYVGGLVGYNSDVDISGYSRAIVRRASGSELTLATVIGFDNSTSANYHSETESKIYDGETGTNKLTATTGNDGTAIRVRTSTLQGDFNELDFGSDIGQWTWVSDGMWPAINIDNQYPLSSASDQPTEPCVLADNYNQCLFEIEIQLIAYHDEEAVAPPVGLGYWARDTSDLSLPLTFVVLTIQGLMADSEYSIHFANHTDNFDAGYNINKSSDNSGVIRLDKADVQGIPSMNVVKIGILGPGILKTAHLATYNFSYIYNDGDLKVMNLDLNGHYVLKKDIVFSAPVAGSTSNYETVGNDRDPFTGFLDGAGHSISGIRIYSTSNYHGLFGVIEAASADDIVVQNLELIDFNVTANAYVGTLVGWLKRGTVNNVDVRVSGSGAGKVEIIGAVYERGSDRGYGGGLVGRASTNTRTSSPVTIQNSSSETLVQVRSLDAVHFGGLVGRGEEYMILRESYATGDITKAATGQVHEVGGLVGYNAGVIESSYATGNVTGNRDVGGLVGYNFEGGTVSGYATGDVTGDSDVGGLVGHNYFRGTVSGYATGNVSGYDTVGGLVGYGNSVITGYATGDVTGNKEVGGLVGYCVFMVTGYATGLVSGKTNVGGLVGESSTASRIEGYSRATVRRVAGANTSFAKVIGTAQGTNNVYSSVAESKIYDGDTGTMVFVGSRSGNDGTAIGVRTSTLQDDFAELDFGTDHGQWTWVSDGMWPALNIGDEYPLGSAADQETEICIYTEDRDLCFFETTIQVSAYYDENAAVTTVLPLGLGQGIRDTANLAMPANDEILTIQGLMPSSAHTIHFATSADNFDAGTTMVKTSNSSGTLSLNKLELASVLPTNDGSAIGISGSGIMGTPHIAIYHPLFIYSTYDLQAMRLDLLENYVLQRNIEFTIPSLETESNFESVGNLTNPFSGTLDGAGYTITGLQIYDTNTSTGNYQGLFGVIEATNSTDIVAKNLRLIDFKITGNDYVASLAGRVKKGLVTGYTTGTVTANNYVGGLVGYNDSTGSVVGYNTGTVTGIGSTIGGLVGFNDSAGSVTGYVTGLVIGSGDNIGGLLGWNKGNVIGYTRAIIRRASGGTSLRIGKTIGLNSSSGTVSTYSSMSESEIYNDETGETVLSVTTGVDGEVVYDPAFGAEIPEVIFTEFTFSTDIGDWTSEVGKWPAINFSDTTFANSQPIDLP